MAEMHDVLDEGEMGELEAVEEQLAQQAPEVEQEPDIPEKYRGKSVVEIAKMHQEAEKSLSRQGQELGEIRKLADELLKTQMQKKDSEPEKPQQVDFFENPEEAIRQAVESNPKVIAAENLAIEAQKAQRMQRMKQLHPDMDVVIADPEFATWVRSSPVRMKLLQQADAYDVDAGHELLSTFKELRSVKQKQTTEIDNTVRDQTLKAVSVDTGGSGESSRKVYRRADLIRLKISNPAKYEAMQDEIYAAYNEGRVR